MTPFPQHPVLLVDDDPDTLRTKDLIISEYDLMHLLYCLSSYAKKQHFKFLECLKNIQIVVVDRL
jgi:hypothetical protein